MSDRGEHLETYIREALRPTRILMVEDHQETCDLMQLCSTGFNVQWEFVQQVETARQRFAVERYDLILLDLRLAAGRSGAELLEDMEHDDTRNFIIFTRYLDSQEAKDAIRHGALVFVIKPDSITRKWMGRFLRPFGVPTRSDADLSPNPQPSTEPS